MKRKLKMIEAKVLAKKHKMLKAEEADDGAFYIAVDAPEGDNTETIAAGDQVLVGPFDTPSDAQAAVIDLDGDITPEVVMAVDGEVEPVPDDILDIDTVPVDDTVTNTEDPSKQEGKQRVGKKVESTKKSVKTEAVKLMDLVSTPDGSGQVVDVTGSKVQVAMDGDMGDIMEYDESEITLLEKKAKTFSVESVRANARRKIVLRAEEIVADTSAKEGEESTTDAAGAVKNDTNAPDSGTSAESDPTKVTADGKTPDVAPNTDGTKDTTKPDGDGTLDSNGGDLGSVKESAPGVSRGDYVTVTKINSKVVLDRGFVESKTKGIVSLSSGGSYDVKTHTIMTLA